MDAFRIYLYLGPVLATAVSQTAWYSWCSEKLTALSSDNQAALPNSPLGLDDLIPLEAPNGSTSSDVRKKPRLVIGHNVSFDRIRVREQYFQKVSYLVMCKGGCEMLW